MRKVALVVGLVVAVLGIGAVALFVGGSFSSVETPDRDTDAATFEDVPDRTPPNCPSEPRGESEPNAVDEPKVVELYPNPPTDGNVGEFFVLEAPPETSLENWTVTDGHTEATLPNETVSGDYAVTMDANATAELTDTDVLELEGHLRLAADGDRLEVHDGTTTVETVEYDHAPEGQRWHAASPTVNASTGDEPTDRWWPDDASCFPTKAVDVEEATTFVLPDETDLPLETIRNADDRLLVAGYTFTSEPVAAELRAASERGVDVRLLLESGPVGGTPEATEPLLKDFEASGVEVRAIGGEGARYQFHHPKYAVADDDVIVTSENWKPSGVGGESSRGWGVVVENATVADHVESVFRIDFDGRDTMSNERFREEATFVEDEQSGRAEFETTTRAETVPVDGVELLLAPDNAEQRLQTLIEDADDEILIKQAAVTDPDFSLVEASLEAADRGVEVRLLLDSTWYVEDDNAELKAVLEQRAADDDLPLEVALVEPDGFEKIHAKGVIIDGETVVVGSANWNDNAFENNRELMLAVHGEAAAIYYREVFESDWEGTTWSFPLELSLGVVLALLLAAGVGHRYITFGDRQADAEETVGWSVTPDGSEPRAADTDRSRDRNSRDTEPDDR